jgi:hypothetical protein
MTSYPDRNDVIDEAMGGVIGWLMDRVSSLTAKTLPVKKAKKTGKMAHYHSVDQSNRGGSCVG